MATKVNYTAPDFVNNSAPKLNGTNMANLATAAEVAGQILDAETDAGRAITQAATAAAQKTALGLDQVDNTSDANKPVSTAQATAITTAAQSATNAAAAANSTDEVITAPSHWWVLVSGALKRMTHAGWLILVRAAVGWAAQAVGFTISGGTTSKTLTVSADADTVNIPTTAGKNDANAIGAASGAAVGNRLVSKITEAGYSIAPATGADNLDNIADGTIYKRILATKATGINNSRRIYVKSFGAVGDGVTDDTAAIQAALDESDDGVIIDFGSPDNTYLISSHLTFNNKLNTILEGNGATIKTASNLDYLIKAYGASTSSTITSTLTKGDTSFTVASASAFAVGDVFHINANASDTLWNNARTDYLRGEFGVIKSISETTITIESPLLDSYIADATFSVLKYGNLVIRDLTFRHSDVNHIGVYLQNLYNVTLDNVKIYDAQLTAIKFLYCYNVNVTNCRSHAKTPGTFDGQSYGLKLDSVQNAFINGGSYYSGRHAVDTGGEIPNRFIIFNGVIADNDTNTSPQIASFNNHENIEYEIISDCIFKNGAIIDGRNIKMHGCIAIGRSYYGLLIRCSMNANGTFVVENNQIIVKNSSYAGISLVSALTGYDIYVKSIIIRDNNIVISGTPPYAISVAPNAAGTLYWDELIIHNISVTTETTQTGSNIGINFAGAANKDASNLGIIDIDRYIINSEMRGIAYPAGGSTDVVINIRNSHIVCKNTSAYHSSLYAATYNISNTVFDGGSASSSVTIGVGYYYFRGCTFKGLTTACLSASSAPLVLHALNCENIDGTTFCSNSSTIVIVNVTPFGNIVFYATSRPTTGTYKRGDIWLDTTPNAGEQRGEICTVAGTPGTWKGIGLIES